MSFHKVPINENTQTIEHAISKWAKKDKDKTKAEDDINGTKRRI